MYIRKILRSKDIKIYIFRKDLANVESMMKDQLEIQYKNEVSDFKGMLIGEEIIE